MALALNDWLTMLFLYSPPLRMNMTREQFYALPFVKRVWYYNWASELSFISVVVGFLALHFIGDFLNRRIAYSWITAQVDNLRTQFHQVGFDPVSPLADVASDPAPLPGPKKIMKRLGPLDFIFYATGRLNVYMMHGKLTLLTRNNLITLVMDYVLSFFTNLPVPSDRLELLVTPADDTATKSTYDGFVFAIVHKSLMKSVRDHSYDLSLTRTTDSPKLPLSFTVMSEASEVTEALLTPELAAAIKAAENVLQYLVISDLPVDRFKSSAEYIPKKRALLVLTPRSSAADAEATTSIINAFLATIDVAVVKAHWRPEVLRKLKNTRDEEVRKLKKVEEEERAEELARIRAKEKKDLSKTEARGLTAEEQKKLQAKEREKDVRRMRSKQTRKY
ncbi:uncharacterized protein V1518DRAFT_413567 [Limtongia smithiae]|uniref:uncharacterized protein n=1 Tax=Limtongia smithiae TaxID=1125753 RepID=UPI0034CD6BC6